MRENGGGEGERRTEEDRSSKEREGLYLGVKADIPDRT